MPATNEKQSIPVWTDPAAATVNAVCVEPVGDRPDERVDAADASFGGNTLKDAVAAGMAADRI